MSADVTVRRLYSREAVGLSVWIAFTPSGDEFPEADVYLVEGEGETLDLLTKESGRWGEVRLPLEGLREVAAGIIRVADELGVKA